MKRYSPSARPINHAPMEEDSLGHYVKYSEVEGLISALKKIRDQDYRGNKPESISIADEALTKVGIK